MIKSHKKGISKKNIRKNTTNNKKTTKYVIIKKNNKIHNTTNKF